MEQIIYGAIWGVFGALIWGLNRDYTPNPKKYKLLLIILGPGAWAYELLEVVSKWFRKE